MGKRTYLALLLIFLLCSSVFASVAVKENGTYKGEATTVNIDNSLSGTFDGSVYTVSLRKVKALIDVPTVSITATDGTVFTFAPTQDTTFNIYGGKAGQAISLVFDCQKTTSYSMTFNTGFKSAGKLATGATASKVFTVNFINDSSTGTNFTETGRTTAY